MSICDDQPEDVVLIEVDSCDESLLLASFVSATRAQMIPVRIAAVAIVVSAVEV